MQLSLFEEDGRESLAYKSAIAEFFRSFGITQSEVNYVMNSLRGIVDEEEMY